MPGDKLEFFDVKEGWEPLFRKLGMDVPEGREFPRINDGKAIEEFAAREMTRGLVRWAVFLGVVGVVTAAVWKLWR